MTFSQVEMAIVQALLGLLVAAVTVGISYVTSHLKAYLAAHTNGKAAQVANSIVDGLARIAEAVVQDFNQRVVHDAKANGVWNAQLAEAVKREAVQAVMDQGSALVALAKANVGNVEALVSALIEKAVNETKAKSA